MVFEPLLVRLVEGALHPSGNMLPIDDVVCSPFYFNGNLPRGGADLPFARVLGVDIGDDLVWIGEHLHGRGVDCFQLACAVAHIQIHEQGFSVFAFSVVRAAGVGVVNGNEPPVAVVRMPVGVNLGFQQVIELGDERGRLGQLLLVVDNHQVADDGNHRAYDKEKGEQNGRPAHGKEACDGVVDRLADVLDQIDEPADGLNRLHGNARYALNGTDALLGVVGDVEQRRHALVLLRQHLEGGRRCDVLGCSARELHASLRGVGGDDGGEGDGIGLEEDIAVRQALVLELFPLGAELLPYLGLCLVLLALGFLRVPLGFAFEQESFRLLLFQKLRFAGFLALADRLFADCALFRAEHFLGAFRGGQLFGLVGD